MMLTGTRLDTLFMEKTTHMPGKPNLHWTQPPLFERSKWETLRFGDVVDLVSETNRNPRLIGLPAISGWSTWSLVYCTFRHGANGCMVSPSPGVGAMGRCSSASGGLTSASWQWLIAMPW